MKRLAALVIVLLAFLSPVFTQAQIAGHVVISQIQIGEPGSGNADHEFVELYNPTGEEVDLQGWRLRLGANNNLVASMAGVIPSHGFFLVAHPEYTSISTNPDMVYSATSSGITANSSIALQRNDGEGFFDVDRVGMGTATLVETAAALPPAAGQSIVRKALGWDTDNNLEDFMILQTPTPRNSNSPTQLPATPNPFPDPSPTPASTTEPTPTPTPTTDPTPTPTPEPTPTPTPTPTSEPSPDPTPEPSPVPSPTPSFDPQVINFPGLLFSCQAVYQPLKIFGMTFWIPRFTCVRRFG